MSKARTSKYVRVVYDFSLELADEDVGIQACPGFGELHDAVMAICRAYNHGAGRAAIVAVLPGAEMSQSVDTRPRDEKTKKLKKRRGD